MSATTKMLAMTTVTCDHPKCTAKAMGPGKSSHVRADLMKKGWNCNDKRRVDHCPDHGEVIGGGTVIP